MKKAIIIACAAMALSACAPKVAHLEHSDWAPDVKENLNAFMDEFAHSKQKNYAVFDFDNTSSIFDITENQMQYQIDRMCFEMTPAQMHDAIRTVLDMESGHYNDALDDIDTAYAHLYEKYGPFSWKGVPDEKAEALHCDPYWGEFGSKMIGIYEMILQYETPTIAYKWDKNWVCGMTDAVLDSLSYVSHGIYSAIETRRGTWSGHESLNAKAGVRVHGYLDGFTVTDNTRELWKTLKANGIDVWVCSASGINQVLCAIDIFGLHEYCTGVLAMTCAHDAEGKLTSEYDYNGHAFLANADGSWTEDTLPVGAMTCGPGKVTTIENCIAPKYDGRGPLACFMDSTGDFNFCTEFASTRLVVCFNRADRKVTDGGGLIAEVAIYERDVLGYDLRKAGENNDILFLLQGRDDNGMRGLRPSNKTLRFGETEERLFANEQNEAQYEYICEHSMSVKEALETFALRTPADSSVLGFKYGFLDSYDGYRCR
ncbi:MAG: hypothetical protein KBS67_05170 [Bacteroidales bacterium]|nr:hypothetical protein [Candidatus Cryptobacteroides equifaecalis]